MRAFSRALRRHGSDPLVLGADNRMTFAEADALSKVIADQVGALKLLPGSIVGLSAPDGPAFLAGLLALRRVGVAVLLLDHAGPPEEQRRLMTAVGAVALLKCADTWPSDPGAFSCHPRTTVGQYEQLAHNIAVVKVTSGSTGSPRGVSATDDNLLTDEENLTKAMGFRDTDRLLAAIPFSHSYGFTTLALTGLVRGLPLVMTGGRGPFAFRDAASAFGATVFPTVPAYLNGMLRTKESPALPPSLRLVVSAGALLPAETAARFRHTYGRSVHVLYGSSECGGICYDSEGLAAERGTVGAPVPGVRVSLKPLDDLLDVSEGLVQVESAAVGVTYLPDSDPRLTDGRFQTSDVGAWTSGELILRHRVDRVINVRGRKVDPLEVERVLRAIPGVLEAFVVGVPTQQGADEMVRAAMVAPGIEPQYEKVIAWCRTKLAEHKVPRSIVFLDEIPRTSRGKVDRQALSALPVNSANRARQ